MKPQFSIVIPIYNAEATLQRALDSVSGQTYREFEVICVNDGSTDGSDAICQQWAIDNPNLEVSLLSQKNKGLGYTRNRGIAKASHGWVAFLDADDVWDKTKLQVLASAIQNEPADIYYHRVKSFGLNIEKVRPCPQISSIKELLTKGNPIMPSAVAGKTYLFQKHQFSEDPNIHGAEDLDLWIRMLHQDISFQKVDNVLAHYREEGGMSTRLNEHVRHVFNVLEMAFDKEQITQTLLVKAKRRKYLEAARFYHKRKNFDMANRYYTMADFKSMKILGFRILSFFGIRL